MKPDAKDKEIARWKNRALEACEKACWHCEEYVSGHDCGKCRITKIREEAATSESDKPVLSMP